MPVCRASIRLYRTGFSSCMATKGNTMGAQVPGRVPWFGWQEPDGGMEGTDGVGGVLVLGFSICMDASFWGRVRMGTMRPCHPMRRWSGRSLPLISAVRAAIIGNMG